VIDANTRAGATSEALLVDRLKAGLVLSVSPGTIDNLRRSGELPSVKIGTRRLFDMADLRRFIEERKAVRP
jgi:excisionase family DNA binding protein